MTRRALVPSCTVCVVSFLTGYLGPGLAAAEVHFSDSYGQLPLHFEANRGQLHADVRFVARGRGYTLFLTNGGEAVLSLSGETLTKTRNEEQAPNTSGAVVRLKLVGADQTASSAGRDLLPGKVNYLTGPDPQRWHTGIATFSKVEYDDVYPGVDLVYYGNQGQLEYDFVVQPGADLNVITLQVEGADRLEIDDAGDLVVHVGDRQVRQRKPVVYQVVDDARRAVAGQYALLEAGRVKFVLGDHDRRLPLVIDPVLVYSTYLGGALSRGAADGAFDIAIDSAGNAYVTGVTSARDFPSTAGAYDSSYNHFSDAFVAKLDSTGSTLLYSTFLGGAGDDAAGRIAVDAGGNAYVTGGTGSSDFPTTPGAYDTSWDGIARAFVVKIDATGSALMYSSFFGVNSGDQISDVVVDPGGNAYLAGSTTSGNFPTTVGAYDTTFNGGNSDAFVAKLNQDGSMLLYSTFLGGSSIDSAGGLALDAGGNLYVTGATSSSDFPTTPGAYDTTWNNSSDVFVSKLDASGGALIYSTLVGGSPLPDRGTGGDFGRGIAVDWAGNAYVTGVTNAGNFPITPGGFGWLGPHNQNHGFVSKIDASGAGLIYSTYLGGGSFLGTRGQAVAVDADGNAYVTGSTGSSLQTTAGAYDETYNGSGSDVFVTKLGPNGPPLIYSTFVGGSGEDGGQALAIDAGGNVYLTGDTCSTDFPATPGTFDNSADGCDALVTMLNASGAALVYSTHLGGGLQPGGFDDSSAIDGAGSVYVTGSTVSADFPTTAGAYDTIQNAMDVFVTKLDETGSTLVYSTFLGGSGIDVGRGLAVDAFGHAHVTGDTGSSDFPTTAGAYDTTYNGDGDVFVTKLSATGGALDYSTVLGGSRADFGSGVAVDTAGNAYVAGGTNSADFPTTAGAYDTGWSCCGSDLFVTKLDATGAALGYSTFLGGMRDEFGRAVAVDTAGHAYVTGTTFSSDFPTTAGAYDSSYSGGSDVFLTEVDATGAGLSYSTFLGGTGEDDALGLAVDDNRNAYVTGGTNSADFPTTAGAYDTTANGNDAFVTKLDATDGSLTYSTFLGGSGGDSGRAVVVDARGNAWVTGVTSSDNFPTTAEAYDPSANGGSDVFVTRLDATGAALAYSTFLGGSGFENSRDVAVDAAGNVYVTGSTSSSDFPTTSGAYDTSFNGIEGGDVFITKIGTCGVAVGSGVIRVRGAWAGFGLRVKENISKARPEGNVAYYDRAAHQWIRSTEITRVILSGPKATIFGQGQTSTREVVSFRADITDGQPDTFRIEWAGYSAAGPLTYGDGEVRHTCGS